jgi:hypothetical protein
MRGATTLDDPSGADLVEVAFGYGLIGAYARIWLWSLAALGVSFGVFSLVRVT